MRQHRQDGQIPPLGDFKLVGQIANVHHLTRIPHHHLDEGVVWRRPQVDRCLGDRAVEPELIWLVCGEVLVRQVRVVVPVQARHRDLAAHVANVELTHRQRSATRLAHPVILPACAWVNVVPEPLVVHPNRLSGVF